MVVRGVYSQEEQRIIANFEEEIKAFGGWIGDESTLDCPHPVIHRVVSRDLMQQMVDIADPGNPLWSDEAYARRTRWGSIIAPPFFQHVITHGGIGRLFLKIPPGMGAKRWFPGTDWEFFLPIRENDSFKVWCCRPRLLDITSPDGKGPRRFRIVSSNIKYINQRDEVVTTFKRYFDETILPEPAEAKNEVEIAPDYQYSEEEMSYIDRLSEEEEIRGSRIRFWEDVSVGEELKPVVMGPITLRDLIKQFATMGLDGLPTRELRKRGLGVVIDPLTNIWHAAHEIHLSDRVAQMQGSTKASLNSPAAESLLGRMLTNWMGDDGFIRRFFWRMLAHTHRGDTIIGRGKVVKKYVENGEHMVDISAWTESMGEGEIHHGVLAAVRLLSEEDV